MNFCVKCGKDCEKTINGLCIDCFLDGRQLASMPHHTDLQICTNCREFYLHDNWTKMDRMEAVEEAGVDQLSFVKEAKVVNLGAMVEQQDDVNYVVHVQTTLDVSGVEVDSEASVIVRVKNTVCKRCSRVLGNYYESTLQIRTVDKEISSELKDEVLARVEHYVDQQSRTNRDIFISKMELVPGGVDVYLSSIQLGKALAKVITDAYSAEMKEAAKLVGQTRDGLDMYRVTYLVRLPDYHVGDVVEFGGRYQLLTRVANTGGKVMDLVNFRERAVKRTEMCNIKVHTKASDLRDADIISRSKNEVQILHPVNYSAVDIVVPDDATIGESIKVVDIDGVLYYVPQKGETCQ